MANWLANVKTKLGKKFRRRRGPLVTTIRLSGVIGSAGGIRQGLNLSVLETVLERAFQPSQVKAVAISVNSPGGSPVQSALIAERIRELADEKNIPVFAFAEDVAASGGYWLACAADEIFAHSSSILGSIGVVTGGFGFTELIKKIGIERRLYTSGNKKAMLDPFLPTKSSDLKHLKSLQLEIHNEFKDMVKTRRKKLVKSEESEIFSGAFWSGKKALELGLIDGIGDVNSILREKFGADVRIKPVKQHQSFLKRKFGFGEVDHDHSNYSANTANLAGNLLAAIENRLAWQRFGL